MSLRNRVLLWFGAGASAFVLVAVALQARLEQRARDSHARSATVEHVEAAQRDVGVELARLLELVQDFDGRDAAAFGRLEGRLGPADMAFLIAEGGRVAWSGGDEERMPDVVEWLPSSPLGVARPNITRRSGAVWSPGGPVLGASNELLELGERLVVVRPLAAPSGDHGQGLVELLPARPTALDEEAGRALAALSGGAQHTFQIDAGLALAHGLLEDPTGRPAVLVRASAAMPAGTSAGVGPFSLALWLGIAAVLAGLGLRLLVGRYFVEPLRALQQRAERIGRSDHGRLELGAGAVGEVGSLARTLDRTFEALEASHQEIVKSARRAGMTDVSKGVVHSVGNVLSSVNVSTGLIARELGAASVGDLRLLIRELEEHRADLARYLQEDPNGRYLLPFLDAMTTSLEELRARCSQELESMERNLAHAVELLRSIDRYSSGGALVESVDVAEVLELSLGIARMSRGGAAGVEVERDFRGQAIAHLDRHQLSSVLIHVVGNALDALEEKDAGTKRLLLAAYPSGDGRIVIEVGDNGVGIAPADLDDIFRPGFTTKPDGAGEGLHSAANICRELGIAIGASSDGVGRGALFKLRVPIDARTEASNPSEPRAPLPSLAGAPVSRDRREGDRRASESHR